MFRDKIVVKNNFCFCFSFTKILFLFRFSRARGRLCVEKTDNWMCLCVGFVCFIWMRVNLNQMGITHTFSIEWLILARVEHLKVPVLKSSVHRFELIRRKYIQHLSICECKKFWRWQIGKHQQVALKKFFLWEKFFKPRVG